MNLVIDKGNTLTKIYIFDKHQLITQEKHEDIHPTLLDKLFKEYPIEKSIYSHVGNINESTKNFLEKHSNNIEFNHTTPIPFKNNYTSPETLGLDRIAIVAAAHREYPSKNVLCIDLGTCITYDFKDSAGIYYGGSISPGLTMRFNALNTFTAKLPLVSLEYQKPSLIGDSTFNSIRSGVYWGMHTELTGTIEAYSAKYQELIVLLSGGDIALFDTLIKNSIFARPDLVAEGLNTILEYNAQNIQ
jgi:type III pantothenate kinase